MIEIKDIVTLSDHNEYQVVSKVDYEYRIYYYLIDINEILCVGFFGHCLLLKFIFINFYWSIVAL